MTERLSTSRPSSAGVESVSSQHQRDLEVELLERKVRLFLGRADLIEQRGEPSRADVHDDVAAVQDKWNTLVMLVDAARRDEAENERLHRRSAEVDIYFIYL